MFIRKTALTIMAVGIGLYGCGQDTPLETTDAVAMSGTVAAGKVAVDEGETREDIGTQLGLTEEQQEALQALRQNNRAATKSLRESLKGTEDREAARAQMKSLREGFKSSLDKILTDDQKAQLDQIRATRQEAGKSRRQRVRRRAHRDGTATDAVAGRVALDGNGPDRGKMADRLGLTKAQREAANALHADHRAEATALGLSWFARETIDDSSDREAIRAQMKALRDQHKADFEEILTGEQKTLLEELHADREELHEERQAEGHRGKSRRRSSRRHGN